MNKYIWESSSNGIVCQLNSPKSSFENVECCSAGCDVNHIRVGNVRPYLRGTALKLAAHRGCLDVVKVLLDAGADPNLTGTVLVVDTNRTTKKIYTVS